MNRNDRSVIPLSFDATTASASQCFIGVIVTLIVLMVLTKNCARQPWKFLMNQTIIDLLKTITFTPFNLNCQELTLEFTIHLRHNTLEMMSFLDAETRDGLVYPSVGPDKMTNHSLLELKKKTVD